MACFELTEVERNLLEGLMQPFAIYQFVDKRVVTIALSDGFCKLFGYEDRDQAYHDMNNDMYKDTHPDDVSRIANAAIRFATEGGKYEVVYRTRIKGTSDYRIVHAIGEHVLTETGQRLAHVWYTDEGIYREGAALQEDALNLTLGKALKKETENSESRYDFLTGLPSMTYFFELAEAGAKVINENGGQAVLLFIDLSGMRYFNAKYSFAEGDRFLKEVADLLKKKFSNENCCHIGGDHFAVYTKREGLNDTLEELFDECAGLNGGVSLPMRVGIYTELSDVAVSTACNRAKLACDELRGKYRSDFAYYYQELSQDALQRQYVLENIDRAIDEKWVKVYFQPIVRAVDGKVCNEEALSRWIDPTKGMLTPDEFIPALEESYLIYKLDLYVLDQVLKKMNDEKESGITVVPHSVNLSRSDFETCDIVEEVRSRVDAAGIDHNLISIEITESVVGNDFSFMKEQVGRFKTLGFPVWMDDFGSGYSSLDVLQNIKFDLIKFDMNFLRKMDEGNRGKVIMTELVRMATSLGLDTICEGVETLDQVKFLKDIGCSKFQGFYYCKPISYEALLERIKNNEQIGFENPDEADYYSAVGRLDLNNISALVANKEPGARGHYYNTLPMSIIEVSGSKISLVRSNASFRKFIDKVYGIKVSAGTEKEQELSPKEDSAVLHLVKSCKEWGSSAVYDEHRSGGMIIHYFAKRISQNPVTGNYAVAVAVLSISEVGEGATYAELARALASDYLNIYYVDLDDDKYIGYRSQKGEQSIAEDSSGEHFFSKAAEEVGTRIFEKDRELFKAAFTKEKIIKALDEHGVFNLTYRLIDSGEPLYANMKITRMPDGRHIIIGVSIIDSQMKEKKLTEELRKEHNALARVMALSNDYISIYSIDPKTGRFFEYGSTDEYKRFGLAKTGEDFFEATRVNSQGIIHPEDMTEYMKMITRESIMNRIKEKGFYSINYRLLIDNEYRPVCLKIVPVEESDGDRLVAGIRLLKQEGNN